MNSLYIELISQIIKRITPKTQILRIEIVPYFIYRNSFFMKNMPLFCFNSLYFLRYYRLFYDFWD